jgi:hypothetical protein
MIDMLWAFLKDGQNREILGWLGGGLVVVIGGLWAAFKFLHAKSKDERPAAPTINASGGGSAAGRDVSNVRIQNSVVGDVRNSHIVIGPDEEALVKRISEAQKPWQTLVDEARKEKTTYLIIGAIVHNAWLLILYRLRKAKRSSRLAP